jgi:hypothetical protein
LPHRHTQEPPAVAGLKKEKRLQEEASEPHSRDRVYRDLTRATRRITDEIEADPELAAKLAKRRAEAREGNLVWPSEDEIQERKGGTA